MEIRGSATINNCRRLILLHLSSSYLKNNPYRSTLRDVIANPDDIFVSGILPFIIGNFGVDKFDLCHIN